MNRLWVTHMLRNKYFVCILGLVLILCVLLFLSWVALSEKKFDVYAPESYSPEGLKAIHLLLAKSGYHVSVIDKLPESRRNLLVVITTNTWRGDGPTGQWKPLLDWVRRGGTILELSAGFPSIQVTGRKLSLLNIQTGRIFYPNRQSVPLLDNLKYHPNKTQIAVMKHPEQGLYGAGDRFFIYRQSFGAGQLIFWNDVDGLTNHFLKRHPDNAVIFAAIIREFSFSGEIDFYNLAFKVDHFKTIQRPTMIFNHFWVGGLLLFLTVVIVIWKTAARFGRPRPLTLARGRSYDEFVYSLAGLFEQAGIRKFVLDNLWRDLMKTMADLTRLPVDAPPEQLIMAMNRLSGKEYGPLLKLHSSFSDLSDKPERGVGKKLSSKQFLVIASQLDEYRKEFHAWKKSNPFAAK